MYALQLWFAFSTNLNKWWKNLLVKSLTSSPYSSMTTGLIGFTGTWKLPRAFWIRSGNNAIVKFFVTEAFRNMRLHWHLLSRSGLRGNLKRLLSIWFSECMHIFGFVFTLIAKRSEIACSNCDDDKYLWTRASPEKCSPSIILMTASGPLRKRVFRLVASISMREMFGAFVMDLILWIWDFKKGSSSVNHLHVT